LNTVTFKVKYVYSTSVTLESAMGRRHWSRCIANFWSKFL